MKKPELIFVFPAVLFLSFQVPSFADEFNPQSKIRSVTVYTSEAQVERSAQLTLTEGEHRIIIEHLPPQLNESQIFVTGRGEAKVKIRGVLVETQQLEQSFQDKVKALEEQVDAVNKDIESQTDLQNAVSGEIDFLNSLKSAASAPNSSGDRAQDPREVMIKRILPQDYSTFLSYYKKSITEKQLEKRNISSKIKKLYETKSKLERELRDFGARPKHEKKVSVDILCSAPGAFELEVNYIIAPAYWTPSYDARVSPDSKEVILTYNAIVTQSTGEDWENVDLTLSTLKPSLGAMTPPANPWYLHYEETPKVLYKTKRMREEVKGAVMAMDAFDLVRAESVQAPELMERSTAATPEVAETSQGGTAVSFQIKSKETVRSGKSSRKLSPAVLNLKAEFEYETVARLSPHVFLKSTVVNRDDCPLLEGNMDVYLDSNFVGSGLLKLTAPGEEFDLYAGADDGIKVTVENIKAGKKESTGMQDKTAAFSYRIKIENYKKSASNVTLIDRIPIATDNRIKVSSPDFEPKPSEMELEKGIYKWKFNIEPKAKSEVEIHYKVAYPKSGRVIGF